MIRTELSKLIDDRNKALWEKVNKHSNITVEFHTQTYYQCNIIRKEVKLLVPYYNYSIESFTHELLHVEISIKEINTYGYLKALVNENVLLSSIFTDPLLHHISNALEHVKMLPIFLQMGFDRSKFIGDYSIPKCTDKEIDLMEVYLKSSRDLWKIGADRYVGKYFAIKACPNNTIDYTQYLNKLRVIDMVVYDGLNKVWDLWFAYDIDKYDVIYNNYYDIVDILFDSLNAWAIARNNTLI